MHMRSSTSGRSGAADTGLRDQIRNSSLRVRLALWSLLLLGSTQIVVGIFFYVLTSKWLESQVDENLLVAATQIASVLSEQIDPFDFAFEFNSGDPGALAILRDRMFFVRLIDRSSGDIVGSSANYQLPVEHWAKGDMDRYDTQTPPNDDDELRIYTMSLAGPYNLQVGTSLDEIRSTEAGILRLLAAASAVTIALSILIGWFLGGRALVPIRAISRTAVAINESDLTRRLTWKSRDGELSNLVQTFNSMLDRIELAFEQRRRFTADAAHELRTPLAIMRTGLDVVLSKARDADEYRSSMESFREEVLRLTSLAISLLVLTRADTQPPPVKSDVDVSRLLNTVVEQLAAVAQA